MRGRVQQIGTALIALARAWWAVAVLLAFVAVAAYVAREISNYPADQAAAYRANPTVVAALATMEPKDQVAFYRDVLQYETDNQIKIWTGLVTLLTGVAATAAGVIAWRNLRATQAKLEVDREAQITNRFTQAIGQLGELNDGKPNLEVRLGGIYALERIARDSPRDHWTIMEVLTAYVRENASWVESLPSYGLVSFPEDVPPEPQPSQESQEPQPPRTDIQAVLTVIGRRIRSGDRTEPAGVDLRTTDLRRADLFEARLEGAYLRGAHLEGADLADSDITREQVYSADDHGRRALLPSDWPADWRDQFVKSTNQPPTTLSAQ